MTADMVTVWDLIDQGEERSQKMAENLRVYRDAAEKLYEIVGNNSPSNVDLENKLHDEPILDTLKDHYINTMRETMAEVVRLFFDMTLEVSAKGLQGKVIDSPLNYEWTQIIFGPELFENQYVLELLGPQLLEFLKTIETKNPK